MVMSSHTEFINDGARKNRGIVSSDPDAVQPRGVIMGVIGTRFYVFYLNPVSFKNIFIHAKTITLYDVCSIFISFAYDYPQKFFMFIIFMFSLLLKIRVSSCFIFILLLHHYA